MVLFEHDAADVIVQWVQIWRVWGHWFFSMNTRQFVYSHFMTFSILYWEMRLSWLKQHHFVIFRRISTKLCGEVYIFLFNSCVKSRAKIPAEVTGGVVFMFTL